MKCDSVDIILVGNDLQCVGSLLEFYPKGLCDPWQNESIEPVTNSHERYAKAHCQPRR